MPSNPVSEDISRKLALRGFDYIPERVMLWFDGDRYQIRLVDEDGAYIHNPEADLAAALRASVPRALLGLPDETDEE